MCGGQRAICRCQLSPFIMWAWGFDSGSSGLAESTFSHCATGPRGFVLTLLHWLFKSCLCTPTFYGTNNWSRCSSWCGHRGT